MAREWWNTPEAALGLVGIGTGGSIVAAYFSRSIGLPIGIVILVVGLLLLIRAYKMRGKAQNGLKAAIDESEKAIENLFDIRKSIKAINLSINKFPAVNYEVIDKSYDDISDKYWKSLNTLERTIRRAGSKYKFVIPLLNHMKAATHIYGNNIDTYKRDLQQHIDEVLPKV